MSGRQEGMPCPVDGTQLVISERQGIEIDYCPTGRGVWLDRGELDKIIERSESQPQAQPPQAPQGFQPQQPGYPPHQQGYGHYKHKRRKSFLEELFD